ncbi:MAG: nucleotidyltransferase family protein [Alphaproteobacteria bacterium]
MTEKTKRIEQGFILAAGFGKRMLPLTSDKPKPMVALHGRPMIDYILDDFINHGVRRIAVNTHYKADILHDHLKAQPQYRDVMISHEPVILDTGGGILKALDFFDERPFFVSSGDSYIEHSHAQTALEHLEKFWSPEKMDILILLEPVANMHLTRGIGDYDLTADGRAIRSKTQTGAYMFTSLRINKPEIFASYRDASGGQEDKTSAAAPRIFSYLELLDEAERKGRLYGLVHDKAWHHISSPEDVAAINNAPATKRTSEGAV